MDDLRIYRKLKESSYPISFSKLHGMATCRVMGTEGFSHILWVLFHIAIQSGRVAFVVPK